jgi:Flp pilus assembly secretin CpaC
MLRLPQTRILSKLSRYGLLAGLSALACLSATTVPAAAQDLIVKYDQASIVRLSRPAAEIIIGNPSIADVTIQNGTSLIITGKSFGVTNIIAIDALGQIIRDHRLMVKLDDERLVSVTKGVERESYACNPQCAPTLTIGDSTKYFNDVRGVVKSKSSVSEGGGNNNSAQ